MAILSTDIVYRLSGGAANSDPNASLGGAKSSTAVTDNTLNNLWDDVSGDEGSTGKVEYRCFYVHNAHATLILQQPKIWISSDTTSASDEVDIGLGSSAVNGTEQTIANETTAPSSVTFTHPTTKTAGIALGDIPATQHRAVWVRRTVSASAGAIDNNAYNVTVEGDSAA